MYHIVISCHCTCFYSLPLIMKISSFVNNSYYFWKGLFLSSWAGWLTWCYSSGRTEDAQWELRIKVGSLADLLIRIRPNHFWLLICKMRFLNLPHYLLSTSYTWGTLIKETALKELKNKTSACSWGHSVNFHWGSAMPGALHIKNISLIRAQMHRQIHRVRWRPGGREVGLETTLLEVSNQRWREAHAVRHRSAY